MAIKFKDVDRNKTNLAVRSAGKGVILNETLTDRH